MSEKEKDFSIEDFAIGLVSGLVAGAALAALFAPSSGSRTRQRLQEAVFDAKLKASEVWEKAKEGADKAIKRTEALFGLQEKGLHKRLQQIKTELERFDLSGS